VIELRTERLLLRPWRDDDLEPFASLNADPRVMRHFPSVLTRAESDALAERIRAGLERDGLGLLAAETRDEARFIGFVGLARPKLSMPFSPCVEIGWRLAAEHWNQGYATEAARECVRWAFEDLGLDELVSFTAADNAASRRVMEKLGMRRDAGEDFDHPGLPAGHRLRRHVLYRLPRAAWRPPAPRT
jgi:RimJ/RimL family protein N-acetyltransferase